MFHVICQNCKKEFFLTKEVLHNFCNFELNRMYIEIRCPYCEAWDVIKRIQ